MYRLVSVLNFDATAPLCRWARSAAEVVAGWPFAKLFDECPRYNLLPVIPSSREFDSTEPLAWAGEGDEKLREWDSEDANPVYRGTRTITHSTALDAWSGFGPTRLTLLRIPLPISSHVMSLNNFPVF